MLAGQTGYGSNGIENFLFPLEDMFITQGEWEYTYSHDGTYAMDFQGWADGQRVYKCPVYAPFDCHCIEIYGSSAPAVLWESDNPVNFIDGTYDYACISFTHEDNTFQVRHVGDRKRQGEVISHTGTMGASGDHVHIEAKKGVGVTSGSNYYQNSYGWYMLKGSTHLYDLMGVNDTVITRDYYDNHNGQRIYYYWYSFQVNNPRPVPPTPTFRKSQFPWVLYARKLRDKNKFINRL